MDKQKFTKCEDCISFWGYNKPCIINHMTMEPEKYPKKNYVHCYKFWHK